MFSSRHACPICGYSVPRAGTQAVLVQQPHRRLPRLRWPGLPGVLRSRARRHASAAVAGRWRHPRLGPAQCLLLPDDSRAGSALQVRHRSAVGDAAAQRRRPWCCTAAATTEIEFKLHRCARPRRQARASLRGHPPQSRAPLSRDRIRDRARGTGQVPRHAALPGLRWHAPQRNARHVFVGGTQPAGDFALSVADAMQHYQRAARSPAGAARSPRASSRKWPTGCASWSTWASTT